MQQRPGSVGTGSRSHGVLRGRVDAVLFEDSPHGGGTDLVAQPSQLAGDRCRRIVSSSSPRPIALGERMVTSMLKLSFGGTVVVL